MEPWLILFIVEKILASTCPFTSKVGTAIGFVNLLARYAFIVLVFFFAPEWWYGLVAIAIDWLIPVVTPKPDLTGKSLGLWVYSMIGSHVAPILTVFMYLSLFGIMPTRDGKQVYICTGPQSEVYHKTDDCMGLNRCRGEIKALTRQDAEKLGRRECRICYE